MYLENKNFNDEFKKHKGNIEVNVFGKNDKKSSYTNLITKDPNIIAQVLMDLIILGFPIEKAIIKVNERIKKHDWMGV